MKEQIVEILNNKAVIVDAITFSDALESDNFEDVADEILSLIEGSQDEQVEKCQYESDDATGMNCKHCGEDRWIHETSALQSTPPADEDEQVGEISPGADIPFKCDKCGFEMSYSITDSTSPADVSEDEIKRESRKMYPMEYQMPRRASFIEGADWMQNQLNKYAFMHPSKAKCPECDSRGVMTERGKGVFKDIRSSIRKPIK